MHLLDGLLVIGRETLQGFNGHRLCGNLIVVPRISGPRCVVITAHLLTIDGVFLQALHIFLRTGWIGLREDDGCQGLLVDALVLDLLLQEGHQIGVGSLHIRRQRTSVERTEVEPLQTLHTGERGLVTFLLPFLHLLHDIHHLATHKLKGSVEHGTGLGLRACEGIQTDKHLRDGYRHIETAGHLGPPRPTAVAPLEILHLVE